MFEKPPSLITLETIDALCQLDPVSSAVPVKKRVDKVTKKKDPILVATQPETIEIVTPPIVKVVPRAERDKYRPSTADNIKWL